jgi:metal-sulfur cluster biosynthetic enzyme
MMSEESAHLDIKRNLQLDIKRNEIMEALREVYDPELGMNVVELGLIRRIELRENRCHIEMILTTPFCPYAPELLREVKQTAEIRSGLATKVEMGGEMWDPSMIEEGARDDWGLF